LGPLLRWRAGDVVTLNVTNRLDEPTSIHWHGVRCPRTSTAPPGLWFTDMPERGSFTYRFSVVKRWSYWRHSHSGALEPLGLFGTIVIAPRGGDAHPHLDIQLQLDDRFVDLVEERIDVAFRIGPPSERTAVMRTLADNRRILVGAAGPPRRRRSRATSGCAMAKTRRPCTWRGRAGG
jgi:FtsP/CotA-like multicopper oxidase with cupredoxin domain